VTPHLQFGSAEPGVSHRLRRTAFGLVIHDGLLACVRVERGPASYFDLPGGAVDGDETEVEALVREFVEEAGMTVRPLARIAEAGQFFRKTDGAPINNVGGFWTAAQLKLDPAAKVEADHELVWLPPQRAVTSLRHDAHAWAVTVWMRGGSEAVPYGTIA
jgi:8-oxo-dGTP diphosphatase